MEPYVIEMQLPDGSWDVVPGYGFNTLDEAAEAYCSIPDWDKPRYRVSQIVYHYEPVAPGLI